MTTLNNPQELYLSPAIFEGVDRVRSAFSLRGVLTRDEPLGNNMCVVESVVREGMTLAHVDESKVDAMVATEVRWAHERRSLLAHALGVSMRNVACPKPVHGRDVAIVSNATIPNLRLDCPTRSSADIAVITTDGYASLIASADCPIIDIVDPNKYGAVAQVHAGWQGILAGSVVAVMEHLVMRGTNPADLLINIQPNATEGFELGGEGLDSWVAAFGGEFTRFEGGKSYIDMTAAVIAQLCEFAVKDGRIQTSSAYNAEGDYHDLNTLDDDRFYSHRTRAHKGYTGRNAALLVRVGD